VSGVQQVLMFDTRSCTPNFIVSVIRILQMRHKFIIISLSPMIQLEMLIMHQDSTLAAMLLRPGPLLALTSAQFRENIEVEKVPRVYIRTRQDNVVKPKQQEAMINRWPPGSVYELDSDHSPFFSTPFLLFGLLVKAATFDVGCN
jgi:hypothetical protein